MDSEIVHVGADEHYERMIGLYEFMRYEFFGWSEGNVIVNTPEAILIFDVDHMQIMSFVSGTVAIHPMIGRLRNPRAKHLIVDMWMGKAFRERTLLVIPDIIWEHAMDLCRHHLPSLQRIPFLRDCHRAVS